MLVAMIVLAAAVYTLKYGWPNRVDSKLDQRA